MSQSKDYKTDIGEMTALSLLAKFSERELNKGFLQPTTGDKIKYFYNLLQTIGQFDPTKSAKNNDDSNVFRDAGCELMTTRSVDVVNGMYTAESSYSAMQLFNKAICSAESTNSSELSASYINRSTVLSSWKQDHLRRENIELAKSVGLPKGIDAKQLDAGKRYLVTQCKLKNGSAVPLQSLEKPKEPQPHKGDNPIKLSEGTKLTLLQRDDPIVSKIHPCFNYDRYRSQASLSFKRHANIPFAANCLKITYDSKHGRNVTTNMDLKPGQIVVIDAMSTNDDHLYRYTKCTNCYEDNFLSLLPCPSCSTAMFCSDKCLAESKTYHDIECPISDVMIKLAWNDSLALRMTVKAYKTFGDASELNDFCKSYNDERGQLSYDAQMTDRQRYKQIYGFERKESSKDLSKLLVEYCKVAFLYHVLITLTKFNEMLETDDDHNTLMELLYRHIQIANRSAIDLYQFRRFDFLESGFDKPENSYAKGIYELSSLFKHSCVPNIAIVANGRKIIVYCCRPISKGSPLLRSYGNLHYFQHHRSIRQEALYEKFSINCQCEACTKNYPAEYERNCPDGRLPPKYDKLMVTFSLLDYEVENLRKYLEVLEKFDKKLPWCVMNRVLFVVHRIMKLKHGDVSASLITSFRLRTTPTGLIDELMNNLTVRRS